MFTAVALVAALVLPPGPLARAFEAPPGPYAAGHRGIDLAALPGQPVIAPMSGTVTFTGQVANRPVVSISNGRATISLEPVGGDLQVGTTVRAGDPIGVIGIGGHCSLRCVHVGLRVDGVYVDPSVSRRRLLPIRRWSDVAHAPKR